MSAETELNAALSADPALTAVVGTRIYPDFMAQEINLPGVVYQRVAGTEYITTIHDGHVHGTRVPLEVWCLATTRMEAEAIADLVEVAIEGSFLPVDRSTEFNPDNETYAAVVSCTVWPS